MPKKTRKAKLRSDNRRLQHSSGPTYEFHASHPTGPSPSVTTREMRGIRASLLKTTMLAIMAIGVELVLYMRPWER